MLTHIHIKNFIIVKSLSLDFNQGLHVLTGETGAGKSIWIDAIEIALGERADANMIYPGEKTCDITVCFDLSTLPEAKAWLEAENLSSEDECIIRRTLDREKPSRTTLNGTPIPQQSVRAFSEFLLCIHGQHQHQRLLKIEEQRECLDRYAKNDVLLKEIKAVYAAWHACHQECEALKAQATNKTADLTLWQYQLSELESLQLTDNEYETLFAEYQTLHRNKKFATQLNAALTIFDAHETAPITYLQRAVNQLNTISHDSEIENIKQLIHTAIIHAEEAQATLQNYCHRQEFNEERLQVIEKRLTQLQDIARKHHVSPNDLSDVLKNLHQKISVLEQSEKSISLLEKKEKILIDNYQNTAKKLSEKRTKATKKLGDLITTQLQLLGMQGSYFKISCEALPSEITPHGQDKIQFLIATNKGQPPQPIGRIISGGELSRLSLLLHVATTAEHYNSTLIFDEVDVGIGGKTADLVGRLLRDLSTHAQVLCVTHLPQVAACGHYHYYAEKIIDQKETHTKMRLLNKLERTQELARMLSGAIITEKSLLHATELLTTCENN